VDDPSPWRNGLAQTAGIVDVLFLVETDRGMRPGLSSEERSRLHGLERDNRELKRANEILRKAAAFFAQAELDRRPK
jgi:transposase-like protein